MHKFLRSIGFRKVKSLSDQDKLLHDILVHYDSKKVVEDEAHNFYCEISKKYAPNAGITVVGMYDEEDLFHLDHYFPYFSGRYISTQEEIAVDRRVADASYAVACDDERIGTTVIFYLSNAAEYIDLRQGNSLHELHPSVSFAGLAESGSVLIPIAKEKKAKAEDPKVIEYKNSLYEAAQEGDQEAIENLTMDEVDTFHLLTRRIKSEDIFTIVDTYFMPSGMECELYSVLGDITEVTEEKNSVTGEKIYQIGLHCNDIDLDICINEQDLLGEPAVGRRFKGNIWLQGKLNF